MIEINSLTMFSITTITILKWVNLNSFVFKLLLVTVYKV